MLALLNCFINYYNKSVSKSFSFDTIFQV